MALTSQDWTKSSNSSIFSVSSSTETLSSSTVHMTWGNNEQLKAVNFIETAHDCDFRSCNTCLLVTSCLNSSNSLTHLQFLNAVANGDELAGSPKEPIHLYALDGSKHLIVVRLVVPRLEITIQQNATKQTIDNIKTGWFYFTGPPFWNWKYNTFLSFEYRIIRVVRNDFLQCRI